MSAMTKTTRFMRRVMATVGNPLSPVDLSRLCALLDRVEDTARISYVNTLRDDLTGLTHRSRFSAVVNELKTAGAAS